jgi:chromosome partitioning protein
LLPANILLANAEKQLVTQLNRERRLVAILKDLNGYDTIILDCPPSLGILTTNALAAADEVLIPIETDYLAFLALEPLAATLKEIEHEINPKLSRFWILPTKHHKRTEHSRSILDEIRAAFPGHVLETVIPYSVRAKESVATSESILTFDPHHAVAEAYRSLVQELCNHG